MEKRLPPLSQLAKVASLLLLLLVAPFVPPSLRAPYLYFLFNALIVALGAEAGFLAAISGPRDDKKPPSTYAVPTPANVKPGQAAPPLELKDNKVRDADAKDVVVTAAKKTIKRCPSRASIFFIGTLDSEAGDGELEEMAEDEAEEEVVRYRWKDAGEVMTKQELFTKAEAFIGDFYKQLRMQREESWKKLHDLYHRHHYKAF